jgi:hypothetical protein
MQIAQVLQRLSDRHLLALHRVAKTRVRVFFADPRNMMALRAEIERRNIGGQNCAQ